MRGIPTKSRADTLMFDGHVDLVDQVMLENNGCQLMKYIK